VKISGGSVSNGAVAARLAPSIWSTTVSPMLKTRSIALRLSPSACSSVIRAQPLDVLVAVVADALAHLGRRQQTARLVVADVPHRHAGAGGELLDRQLRSILLLATVDCS